MCSEVLSEDEVRIVGCEERVEDEETVSEVDEGIEP